MQDACSCQWLWVLTATMGGTTGTTGPHRGSAGMGNGWIKLGDNRLHGRQLQSCLAQPAASPAVSCPAIYISAGVSPCKGLHGVYLGRHLCSPSDPAACASRVSTQSWYRMLPRVLWAYVCCASWTTRLRIIVFCTRGSGQNVQATRITHQQSESIKLV